MKTAEFNY